MSHHSRHHESEERALGSGVLKVVLLATLKSKGKMSEANEVRNPRVKATPISEPCAGIGRISGRLCQHCKQTESSHTDISFSNQSPRPALMTAVCSSLLRLAPED